MFTKKQLKIELERNLALKSLTEIYEDVAVVGMQSVRHQVLTNRIFLEGVSSVYALAKNAFLKQIAKIANKRERERQTAFLRRNKKTVAILISGNQTLLGNLIIDTYKTYLSLVKSVKCDYAVLGKIGSYLLRDANLPSPFVEFPLDDYTLTEPKIKLALQFISRYERVLVVYPKFVTVLSQTPNVDDISGGVAIGEANIKVAKNYFFEPNPRDVIAYFEGQIIEALFRQKLLESILARYGARLTIMDLASKKVTKIIAENLRDKKIIERREDNKKLFSQFAGINLWGGDLW